MESIFKVGDKVRIADLQQLKGSEVPFHVSDNMLHLSGMPAEITHVIPDSYSNSDYPYNSSEFPNYNKPDGCRYILRPVDTIPPEFTLGWKWSSPMLKKVEIKDTTASRDSNSILKIKVTRKPIVLNFKN